MPHEALTVTDVNDDLGSFDIIQSKSKVQCCLTFPLQHTNASDLKEHYKNTKYVLVIWVGPTSVKKL